MSTEDERSVPPDLFSAEPAYPHQGLPAPGTHPYAAAGIGGATGAFASPVRAHGPRPVPPKRSGPLRRLLAYTAVVWGSFSLLLFVAQVFAFASPSDGYYRGGQFLGFAFAVALVVTGMQEISSDHRRRNRYLPWLMGSLAVMVAIAVTIPLVLPRHYPASVQSNFLTNCEAGGGDAARCGCALRWFESHESLSEFIAVDADIRAGGGVPADVTAGIASSCPR